jgi:hypothetical protein
MHVLKFSRYWFTSVCLPRLDDLRARPSTATLSSDASHNQTSGSERRSTLPGLLDDGDGTIRSHPARDDDRVEAAHTRLVGSPLSPDRRRYLGDGARASPADVIVSIPPASTWATE